MKYRLAVALLIVAVLASTGLAGAARADDTQSSPLGYHMAAGDTFGLNLKMSADVPTQGHKEGTAHTAAKVESVLADGLRLHVDLQTSAKERYALGMGVDLSPTGQASNITGVDMNNDTDAVMAKDVASLGVPSLPDAPVAIGTSWQAQRTVFIPKAPLPGIPSQIRVDLGYTVKALRTENGRAVVDVAVTGKEPAGQSVKVNATGTWTVDAATGKPLRAHLEGAATMHVVFSDLKLPFVIDATAPSFSQFASLR